jgi:hypothetical protein
MDVPTLHLNEDFLDEYAAGTLDVDQSAAIEEHLLACELCQSRLVRADQFIALFRAAAESQSWCAKYRPWKLVVTAAAMAAALTMVLVTPRAQLTTPERVQMRSLRGPNVASSMTFGRRAVLVFDSPYLSGARNYVAEIVDLNGGHVLTCRTVMKEGRPAMLIEKLPRGSYWVRLHAQQDDGAPAAEYELLVQ